MTRQTARRRIVTVLVLGTILLAAAPSALAGAINVEGVIVRYSKNFNAYHNHDDETVTIQILEGGGALTVTVLPAAATVWTQGVDLSIVGDSYDVPHISIKGLPSVPVFVTGVVGWCDTFSLKFGAVGYTITYGAFGLYMQEEVVARSIKIQWGWATGAVLDYLPPGAALVKGPTYLPPAPGTPTRKELLERLRRLPAPR